MRTTQWVVLCVLLIPAACVADDPKPDKGKTDPPGAPVQATLTSNQPSYDLKDFLGDKTADDYRKLIGPGSYPPPRPWTSAWS